MILKWGMLILMGHLETKTEPFYLFKVVNFSCFVSVSGTAKEEPLLQRIMSDISIPESPELPTPGVAYNSLSANHVKQLVDSLTQTVFQNVRQ